MPASITWLDKARMERVVWLLDQRLYDLPRASRIAHRREVRGNLTEAARDVGRREAMRRLGSTRDLADGYLSAEFGDGPRPSWLAAGLVPGAVVLILTSWFADAAHAFADGVVAGQPHASGVFTWQGLAFVQSQVTVTFHDGQWTSVGGAFTPLTWALLQVLVVASGRLWRLWTRRGARVGRQSAQPNA